MQNEVNLREPPRPEAAMNADKAAHTVSGDERIGKLVVADSAKEPRQLALLSQAQRALAQATSLDEIKDIRDKAEAARKYVESARLGLELQNHAAEVKLRAERRAGQLLGKLNLAGGDRKSAAATTALTLQKLGLTKHESSRWQREAAVPEDIFERFVQEVNDSAAELTSRALLRLAREFAPSKSTGDATKGETAEGDLVFGSLKEVCETGVRFGCIYADPPLFCGADESDVFGRSLLTIEELCSLPVSEVAEEKAHLHLWLGSDHLPAAEAIFNAWGFRYRSSFVWVQPRGATDKFWRIAHQFLLLGVRGELAFQEKSITSWLRANRLTHGRKPEKVRRLIEHVSPGPYLELFARKAMKGWTVCGDGIQQ